MLKRILIISVIALFFLWFFESDARHVLTLESIQSHHALLIDWKNENPIAMVSLFFVIYTIITMLALPGAVVLTLVAGAIFGLFSGLLIVSFASSIGATLCMLLSRYVLRDVIQRRYGDSLQAINDGIARDGAFYLFTLRLVPLFPFFLINVAMGLTPIRVWTFYWVSQLGMLAGTFIFLNAGQQLADIQQISDIWSPSLVFAFALLGIFPLLAKKMLDILKKQRVYKGFNKPKSYDYNIIVIGAGAGGLVTSYISAAVKAKVALVEASAMGGDCLNTGCVPSKALIHSAKVAHIARNAAHAGVETSDVTIDFPKVIKRIQDVIKKIEPHDSIERYQSLGVNVFQGYGVIINPWTVEITDKSGAKQIITAKNIVLATGAEPIVPDLPGITTENHLTSETMWQAMASWQTLPKRICLLGGGPIGCELAQAFARLGSDVTLIEKMPRILQKEDEEVSDLIKEALTKDGVQLLINHEVTRLETVNNEKQIIVKFEGETKSYAYDILIIALGRTSRLKGYGLENIGIDVDKKLIVNDYLQTKFPNIYAVGDVVGPYQLTHAAAHQAWYAAVNSLFGLFKMFKVNYKNLPWTTFVAPEVARLGLNEQEAKQEGINYEVTTYDWSDLDRAIGDDCAYGFVKVLTEPGKDKILGVTIVGEHAGDVMAEFVLAKNSKLGLNKILGTVHSYPTLSESNKFVAGAWKKNHAPKKILDILQKINAFARK